MWGRSAHRDRRATKLRNALRYRAEDGVTCIFECFFNAAGKRERGQRQFFECVHQAWDTGDSRFIEKLPLDSDLDKGPFAKPNPMRRYLNLRAWWTEPFDILYLAPGLQVLCNIEDQSFSIS